MSPPILAPDNNELGWMFFDYKTKFYTVTTSVTNYISPVVNGDLSRAPGDINYHSSIYNTRHFLPIGSRVRNLIHKFSLMSGDLKDTRTVTEIYLPDMSNWFAVFGQAKNINSFFSLYNVWVKNNGQYPDRVATPHTWIPLNKSLSPSYLGTASPPPPPPKKMCGCDCNTIASIIADQMANQFRLFESIKDHIDSRTKEEIQIFREQLEALEIDLQPIIDRLNEIERNLWNGIPK